ncbi:disulfide bond formation protein B [Roseococcus thiosulfatophilus]|uniref:disulfide bond formation protein B n=1 Tax=Roseococcus thiosulfatophilus TaxID=35813 RepID=UPI001A8F6169|nr:disulfide bond formation protein B [Roseococcus thiosulfatophilus]
MSGALLVALLAVAAPLFAHGSETWFELVPCELCLWQRWPYWAAAALALAAHFVARRRLLWAAGAACLVSAAIAGFHVGVEFRWWPSPLPGCAAPTAGGAMTVEQMMASLAAAPTKPCDEPVWLIPGVPLSMAALNLIYGLSLAGLALVIAERSRRR